MDQNVTQSVKSHYKNNLLCSVINQNDDIIQCLKRINLKDIVFNITYAWRNVRPKTIICSWKSYGLHIHYPLVAVNSQTEKNQENDGTVLTSDLQEATAELCEKKRLVRPNNC
jgi:hypothetical protein